MDERTTERGAKPINPAAIFLVVLIGLPAVAFIVFGFIMSASW